MKKISIAFILAAIMAGVTMPGCVVHKAHGTTTIKPAPPPPPPHK